MEIIVGSYHGGYDYFVISVLLRELVRDVDAVELRSRHAVILTGADPENEIVRNGHRHFAGDDFLFVLFVLLVVFEIIDVTRAFGIDKEHTGIYFEHRHEIGYFFVYLVVSVDDVIGRLHRVVGEIPTFEGVILANGRSLGESPGNGAREAVLIINLEHSAAQFFVVARRRIGKRHVLVIAFQEYGEENAFLPVRHELRGTGKYGVVGKDRGRTVGIIRIVGVVPALELVSGGGEFGKVFHVEHLPYRRAVREHQRLEYRSRHAGESDLALFVNEIRFDIDLVDVGAQIVILWRSEGKDVFLARTGLGRSERNVIVLGEIHRNFVVLNLYRHPFAGDVADLPAHEIHTGVGGDTEHGFGALGIIRHQIFYLTESDALFVRGELDEKIRRVLLENGIDVGILSDARVIGVPAHESIAVELHVMFVRSRNARGRLTVRHYLLSRGGTVGIVEHDGIIHFAEDGY